MPKQKFDVELLRPQGTGTWTYFVAPFSVAEVFGSRARVEVRGTVNGGPFRSSLFPSGDGTHYLVVNKQLRNQACVGPGDRVHIIMDVDKEDRVVIVPEDILKALDKNKSVKAAFEKLSYTHKKEYVEWVESAKHEATRKRRVEKAIVMISQRMSTK